MRNVTSSLALALVVAVSGSACVSSGTYDELLMTQERTKRDLHSAEQERDAARAENEKLLAQLKAEQERATAAAADAEAALAAARVEQRRVSDDLAATLRDKAGLKDSVEQMQKALDELNKRKAEADRRLAEFKSLLARFQSLIDAGKLKVKIVDGRMVVALASDILFASGSAALSKDGKTAVEEVAKVLTSISDRSFQVEGHTDNVPIKTAQFPSNWELASSRALTVVKTMVDAGLPANRVSAASFGDQKPAVANDTPEGKALNRRIEIVVVPDLSTLPGFDELQKAGAR
ncbi:MAG TPA: OmpA family protein [Myxococcota bacterium]